MLNTVFKDECIVSLIGGKRYRNEIFPSPSVIFLPFADEFQIQFKTNAVLLPLFVTKHFYCCTVSCRFTSKTSETVVMTALVSSLV